MDNPNWKRTFALIWAGQFFSILTSSLVNFAVIIWLSLETGSAGVLAWASIAALLPQVVIGPFSGVLVDRWDRKRVMIFSDLFIAACTLLLAVLFWFGLATVWYIFILLALRSVGSAFHMPAMQASTPMLAPADQLTRVAGVNQMIASISQIAGPALGAMFIAIWDIEYVLMFDVAGALIAVASLFFVHIPNPKQIAGKPQNILRELKEGAMAVLSRKGLAWVFAYDMGAMFFIIPMSALFPLMTLQYFGGTEFQAGLVEAVWSVGAVVGGAIMGARVYNVNRVALIGWVYLGCGLAFLLSGLLPPNGYVWFAALTGLAGIAGAVYYSAFTSLLQTKVEPGMLGRVFSLFYTVVLIPSMIGLAGIGFFADGLGLTVSFIFCGAMIMLIGIAELLTPSAMKLDGENSLK